MLRIVDNHYGEDLEAEDEKEIREQVQEYIEAFRNEAEDPGEDLDIVLFNPVTDEEVYFTIKIKDMDRERLLQAKELLSNGLYGGK